MEKLTFDIDSHTVSADKGTELLTTSEFELLFYLIKLNGQLATRSVLAERLRIIGKKASDERVVDSHIKNIRHKLDLVGVNGKNCIKTVHGSGYRIDEENIEITMPQRSNNTTLSIDYIHNLASWTDEACDVLKETLTCPLPANVRQRVMDTINSKPQS